MPNSLETMDIAQLKTDLHQLIEQAREACKTNGELSSECAVAWDAVEEMQAATADRLTQQKSSFDRYCEARPDALECRVYDV